jgi:hypothetical protein
VVTLAGTTQAHTHAESREASGEVRIQGRGTRPHLIFGCDRQTRDLDALFTPALVADLRTLSAGIALSTEDLSPARAAVVRRLIDAGIPMLAWIVLPKEQGYYVNVGNARETAAVSPTSTSGRGRTACAGKPSVSTLNRRCRSTAR